MEAAALREALHAQPFRPFTLRLADGREVSVRHPDFMAVAQNGRRAAVFLPDDSMSILEPLLIVSLEYVASGQGPAPPSGNGS